MRLCGHRPDRHHPDGIAVGPRPRGFRRADGAACAGCVLDDDLDTERFGHRAGKRACGDIGAAAGAERHDDGHGFGGIVRRERCCRKAEACREREQSCLDGFHSVSPFWPGRLRLRSDLVNALRVALIKGLKVSL